MKKINKKNSGFTLIELIIAIAILAVLMTAVSSLMGSSVLSHKKTKAEIKVHTSAQETYNQITDTIMQAKEVVIVAYESSDEIDFSKPGETTAASLTTVVYVKDQEMKDYIVNNPEVYGVTVSDPNQIKFFEDYAGEYLYLKKLVVKTAEPIDTTQIPGFSGTTNMFTIDDNLTAANERINVLNLNASDPTASVVYDTADNVIHTYTFVDENMYYEKKYSFMTSKNDVMNSASEDTMKANLYNDGFSYVSSGAGSTAYNVSGCIVTIDAEKGAIGVEFQFNDLNMTYTTKGMVNTRNSYVLKPKDN